MTQMFDTVARSAKPRREVENSEVPSWHSLSPAAVLDAVATSESSGLNFDQVQRRAAATGPNRTTRRESGNELELLARQFASLPVGLLLGASMVSVLTGGIGDALVTLAVIGLNAGIGYTTERGSERIIRTMTQRQPHTISVMREGAEQLVDQEEILPGDILLLRPNTLVAADARLTWSDRLMMNEALLTGESEPVPKDASAICRTAEPVGSRTCMVHAGSFVVSGTGRAAVVATGDNTETGRIEAEARDLATPLTPLERDLNDLGTKLALVSLGACGAFFAAGYFRGRTIANMFKSAIALAVAAVPEGLPATATTTLALGLRELRRKGVIVRRLEAVEAMGSLQLIAFDKTGTLTQNRMRLDGLQLGDSLGVEEPWPAEPPLDHGAARRRVFEISCLCTEVKFAETEEGTEPVGSSTEAALCAAAIRFGLDPRRLRSDWRTVSTQYRSETQRLMASAHRGPRGAGLLAVKGDPQQVLERCEWVLDGSGKHVRLSNELRQRLTGALDDLAGQGLRVLGFGYATGKGLEPRRAPLIWVGAAALRDPIAQGARELIARLHKAAIRTVMITGDQAATAQNVADELGLSGQEPLRVLDSAALDRLPPDTLSAVAQRTHVFARVPPTKKLHIVRALQTAGLTVGMIGDGFNDAPALKAANVAIAVGAGSTSAARDVADIILAEPDLNIIGSGVEQGRTILSNIRKSVHYLISTNLSEILMLIAETVRHDDVLETPMELLWLNLVSDVLPGLGLALEPPEKDVMSRRPRRADEPLLTPGDLRHSVLESAVIASASIGAHVYGLARYGPGEQTRTVTFYSLLTAQLLHAFACRHDRFEPLGGRSLFGNRALNLALIGSGALQALPLFSSALRRFLGIAAPKPADLVVAGVSGLAAFVANEALQVYRSQGHEEDGDANQYIFETA